MKRRTLQMVILILATFLVISCRNQIKPRTVYWSGSSFAFNTDSLTDWSFYLGYYIELSDTGETKLMTRKMFKSPMEYYEIIIPDSTKNTILELAMNDSMYHVPKPDLEAGCIYDGYTSNLRFQCYTIDRSISFIRPEGNQVQKKLVRIMDNIWEHPIIKTGTFIDLKQYENNTEKEMIKYRPLLLRRGKTIHFIPPKIEPDK